MFKGWASIAMRAELAKFGVDTEQTHLLEALKELQRNPVRARRWPSGISGIDDNVLLGGFYGLAGVSGKMKLGKSLIAYRSAMNAAEAGWNVVYVDAELDDFQAVERIGLASGGDANAWLDRHPNFKWRALDEPVTFRDLVLSIALEFHECDGPALVVIDSLQRAAENLKRTEFLDGIRQLVNWARMTRRKSGGRMGFLLTSEQNRRGGTKGMSIEYACDVLLQMKGKPTERELELDVELSREGGAGSLGKYRRDWERCRFIATEARTAAGDDEPGVHDWAPQRALFN